MIHRKELLVGICIAMILSWMVLPLVEYGQILHDEEFEQAKQRASIQGFQDIQRVEDYPFEIVTRKEVVQRYLRVMDLLDKKPLRETCSFTDIKELDPELQDDIIRSCTLNVFLGDGGAFNPDGAMTKATALVAFMRSLHPEIEYPMQQLYWTPYVNDAYQMGITKRPSGEYLEYPITRYELLLILYRGRNVGVMNN